MEATQRETTVRVSALQADAERRVAEVEAAAAETIAAAQAQARASVAEAEAKAAAEAEARIAAEAAAMAELEHVRHQPWPMRLAQDARGPQRPCRGTPLISHRRPPLVASLLGRIYSRRQRCSRCGSRKGR
mmetsp:Transcript_28190/g.77034  ORF Transcript_28190/g.77034 Transcript_28190/m.77034 type:complete len:131 (-) Transcript_28190:192-584(-)